MGPDADAYVHGPVAVGECLFCHDAHASNHKALLKEAVPDLCYMCHDTQDVTAIADHGQASYENCIRCHDSHGGSSRGLLKADWKQAPH
jgi:predicted CXXCH cytochrome family protein